MTTLRSPAVTLVVACYNHSEFVEQALTSAFSQTYDNFRVIVTDDASSDGSQDAIRHLLSVRGWNCEMMFHTENQGVCATFNHALELVETPYVAFMAADDVMEPHRLARQVPVIESAGEPCAVVCSDAEFIDRDGSVLPELTMSRAARSAPWGRPEFFEALISEPLVLAPSALMRTQALREIGGYDEDLRFEDWDAWLRLAARGHRFLLVDEKLVRYRQLGDSLMRSLEKTLEYRHEEIKILQKHVGDPRLADTQLTARLYHHAVTLYKAGFPSRALAPLMFARARQARDPRAFAYGCLARMRAPGRMLARRQPRR